MRNLLLTSFLIFSIGAFAQEYFPPIHNYSVHDYGKDRNPENWCVVQDPRGVMYFGNGNGVLEYDGRKWEFILVKPGSFVTALATDSAGVIYAGTYGDFGYLKPNTFGQLEYVSLLDKLSEEEAYFGEVWRIFTTKETVYFQSYQNIVIYDIATEEVEVVFPRDDFFGTFHTSFYVDGQFYARERDVGLITIEDGKTKLLKGTEDFAGFGVFGMHKLKDDSLLIVTQELGLWKWKNGAMRQLPEANDQNFVEYGVFGSIELSDGNFAVNTFTEGMKIMNADGKILKTVDRSKGMRSNEVKSLFQDRDDNIWAALGNGIAKINYHSPLSYFNEKSGIEGNVQSMYRFKDRLYVGTSFGLFVENIEVDRTRAFKSITKLRTQVWDFCEVNGVLYIASSDGIYKTDGSGNYLFLNSHNANVITQVVGTNYFLVGGHDGISAYDANFNEIWKYEDMMISSYSGFLSVIKDPQFENTYWFGTLNNGAFRVRFENGRFKGENYTDADGLIDNKTTKPMVFQGQSVFGTTQGVYSFIHEDDMGFDDTLKEYPDYYRGMFDGYPIYDSSFTAKMFALAEATDRTWYSAEDKIGYYDLQKKEFINRPFWGVDFGRINEFYLEDNSILWIGCADGLIRYEENNKKSYHSGFSALIRKFTINGDSTIFSGAFTDEKGQLLINQPEENEIEIDFDFNDVYFSFSAPYFEDDHLPEYSFVLEGYGEEWSPWSEKTEANFTNLVEGDYCFKVRARNIYGTISEEASFKFKILPPWYRTTWAYFMYALVFILILFIGVRISSLRLKRKNQKLEEIVAERTKEIKQKNEVLQHQKQEIEDSINYAQRIQQAILPLEVEMKKWVPRSFVLFRPKDIVSGDFYWFMEKDNFLVFVCADCTGHGVPGAFMSMIGSDRLNNIVSENKIVNPGKILSELNKAIKKSLKQDGEKGSTRDGMDAAICTIDLERKVLLYAGANRPLWVIKNGELDEIKATKVAVAGFTDDEQIYEEHEFELNGDAKFYMSSDGYADQFGGDRGKKYKVKQMKEFIMSICGQPYEQQKSALETELIDWMGDHEQIDDVCVVGFEA